MPEPKTHRCFAACGTDLSAEELHLCLMTEECLAHMGVMCRTCLILHWLTKHDYDPQLHVLH